MPTASPGLLLVSAGACLGLEPAPDPLPVPVPVPCVSTVGRTSCTSGAP